MVFHCFDFHKLDVRGRSWILEVTEREKGESQSERGLWVRPCPIKAGPVGRSVTRSEQIKCDQISFRHLYNPFSFFFFHLNPLIDHRRWWWIRDWKQAAIRLWSMFGSGSSATSQPGILRTVSVALRYSYLEGCCFVRFLIYENFDRVCSSWLCGWDD